MLVSGEVRGTHVTADDDTPSRQLDTAWRAVPTIEELPVVETWAGFRPTSRDDAPIFGPTSVEGLFLATGHHRNGILLAPMTADAVSAAVLGQDMPELARPFTIQRFTNRTKAKAVA